MSALLDSLVSGGDADPARKAALDTALLVGLPGPRSEAWKYTPLRALERRAFVAASRDVEVDASLLVDIPSPRLVFVNGRVHVGLSEIDGLENGVSLRPLSEVTDTGGVDDPISPGQRFERADEIFASLSTALASEGAWLRVDADTVASAVLHLVFFGAPAPEDQAWHLRHAIELGANASLQIIEHHLSAGDHAHLANSRCRIVLSQGARLQHIRIQHDAARATAFLRTDALLSGASDYSRLDLELGAALTRHELNVRLEGAGARLHSNGVLLADGRRHLDTRLDIEHVARDTSSRVLWRGIAAGRGRVVFHGGIAIRAGADGSDASLSTKNLLLSEAAEIDAQPVLEIHADEVKAAHGATVGQLDPTALFYLRSRGLALDAARRLLTTAFCRQPLAMVDDTAWRTRLESCVDTALAREASA